MATPFAKYQSEQVQQLAPGFVEAYGRAGAAIGQGIASLGESVSKGLQIADQKRKEEIATRAKLAPYIRNDDRIAVTEGLFKAGILTKAPDGTAVVSADYAGKVDMAALEKNISFYNKTGGDGSKLTGNDLVEFTARLEAEQKYVADKAAAAKAALDVRLQEAQIAKLNAEAAESLGNTTNYGSVISTLLGGASAGTSASTLPTVTLPDGTSGVFTQGVSQPVSTADTTPPGVAAPAISPALTAGTSAAPAAPAAAPAPAAAEPVVSPALTAGTKAKPKDEVAALAADIGMTKAGLIESAKRNGVTPEEYAGTMQSILAAREKGKAAPTSETEPEVKTWADAAKIVGEEEQIARYRGERLSGMTPAEYVANWKESQAAAPAAPAEAAPAPAAGEAPLEQRATAAGTPIPETYDVAAKAAEVEEKMRAIEDRRTVVRTKYAGSRTALEGQIASANRNLSATLPRSTQGMEMAQAALAYHEGRRKSIDEAEARELKAIDSDAEAIKTQFTTYQAAATAARQARTEDRLARAEIREIKKDEAALTKEERETVQRIVKGYPMISVFTYQGYGMKDPKTGKLLDPALTAGIQEMPGERYTEASEQIKGYNSAQDFLLNMKSILREREGATGDRAKELLQRFRVTTSNMENYFKAELASVFGVAAFRKPIVSGGNFSDADREFVRQAITYLNTAAPDMSNKDLESSLKALSFMINGLYQSQIEGLGMTYNPEAAKARAEALISGGDKVGGGTIKKQVERTDRFYKSFNLNQAPASSITRAEIDAARAELQRTGFRLAEPK